MRTGTLVVTLYLAEGSSLKDKRHVVKSVIARIRQKFNVSIAEIDDLDLWQRATLGIAVVSNDGKQANRVLDKVLDHLESFPEFTVGEVDLHID